MNILVGLLPAVVWGFQPVAVNKIGGSQYNQVFGTTCSAFILATIVFSLRGGFLGLYETGLCFLSGICFSVGQLLQYASYKEIQVSKALPLSTGMQLVGNSLSSILFFGEWKALPSKIHGSVGLCLIIVGIVLTSYCEKRYTSDNAENLKKGIIILLASTIGFVGYSAFPKMVRADGWVKFFPQACGMLLTSTIIVCFCTRGKAFYERKTYQNLITGLVFSMGALLYLISVSVNGVATGFALSQMLVINATIGSIFLLHEYKTKKEMRAVIIGLLFVAGGGVMIALGT